MSKKSNPRPLRWIAAAVIVLLAALCTNLALNWVGRLPGIALKTVNFKGRFDHLSPDVLQTVASRVVQGNFFTGDVKTVRTEFEKLPWVRSASVRRVWPDRLEVTLEEQVPLAYWGTDALLNTHGEIFRAPYNDPLPRFAGPPGSEREVTQAYQEFSAILKPVELMPEEVVLSARRAWQVKLGNDMVLELGRVDMAERLARFVAVSKLVPELAGRRGRIDLRYPNGFALKLAGKLTGGPAKEEAGKTKKTK